MEQAANRECADQLLVVRCQLGEREAFDDLVRRWAGSLRRYALKLCGDPELACDLTQDVWLRVIQGLGRLRDAAQFRPWMFGIAHRTFSDRLRRRYAMPQEAGLDLDALPSAVSDVSLVIDGDEDIDQLLGTGLTALPMVEREVLTLFYLEELSLLDIAAALGIPVGTVKSRLFRARTLLRQQIQSKESPR